MLECDISNHISGAFEEDMQKQVWDFMEFLDVSGLSFERGSGYWKDKFYLLAKYQDEVIYYILLNGNEDNSEPKGLTIWTAEDALARYANLHLDEKTKETIWKYIDICKNCGGCENPGGTAKTIFGKEFNNVCITEMRFDNPDIEVLRCLEEIVTLWKKQAVGNV